MNRFNLFHYNPQPALTCKLYKNPLQKCSPINLQNSTTIVKYVFSTMPCLSPTLHDESMVPSLCNRIALLFPTTIHSFMHVSVLT